MHVSFNYPWKSPPHLSEEIHVKKKNPFWYLYVHQFTTRLLVRKRGHILNDRWNCTWFDVRLEYIYIYIYYLTKNTSFYTKEKMAQIVPQRFLTQHGRLSQISLNFNILSHVYNLIANTPNVLYIITDTFICKWL